MLKTRHIIEYRLKEDPDKWLYYHAAKSEETADELMEAAKRIPGAAGVRMRKKTEQSSVIKEWKTDAAKL